MEKKELTMRDFYNAVIAADIAEDITAYAKDGIAKLDTKNEKRKNTLTKEQKANEEIKVAIVTYLGGHTKAVASEVATALDLPSTQKASALLTALVKEGKAVSEDIKVKGKGSVKGYSLV